MSSWTWGHFEIMLKPYVHVTAALTMWIFAVVLLGTEQGFPILQHVDQVHLYALTKAPLNYEGNNNAKNNIQGYYAANWVAADDTGCLALTNWTGNAACATKRNGLVTYARQQLGCDYGQYKSQACACVIQVLRGIANDSTSAATSPNFISGNFTALGRNMGGQQPAVLNAIDACHYLYRSTYQASQANNPTVRRLFLMFLLTTLITSNAVFYFLVVRYAAWVYSPYRIIVALLLPLAAFITILALDSSCFQLVCYIMLPPVLILLWFEMLFTHGPSTPFIHPFYFAEILATLTVLALVENSVVDYDNLVFEVLKAHAIGFIYMGVLWFTTKSFSQEGQYSREIIREVMQLYLHRPQQDSIFIGAMLAGLISVNTLLAPYTATCYLNVLWWLPFLLVVFAFSAVTWINTWDRFREVPDSDALQKKTEYVRNDALYVSGFLLLLGSLVVDYYWRDYSTVWRATFERVPTQSIQFNSSLPWLTPY